MVKDLCRECLKLGYKTPQEKYKSTEFEPVDGYVCSFHLWFSQYRHEGVSFEEHLKVFNNTRLIRTSIPSKRAMKTIMKSMAWELI